MVTTLNQDNKSLITDFANEYGLEPGKTLGVLKDYLLKTSDKEQPATDAEIMGFLSVANQYNLNPFLKQIYAFRGKSGRMDVVVPIDGWAAIVLRNKKYNGHEFEHHFNGDKLAAITCRMFRKDLDHPVEVTEYMDECVQDKDTWRKWPARMLRHKAYIQCARLAFGISGVVDSDEAEREVTGTTIRQAKAQTSERLLEHEPDMVEEFITVDGEQVNTATGEVMQPEAKSPAFNALLKKLDNANTDADVAALRKSELYKKVSASEKKRFEELAGMKTTA